MRMAESINSAHKGDPKGWHSKTANKQAYKERERELCEQSESRLLV